MGQLIISIGREVGSGGHEIAQKVANHYGIKLYDKNILNEVADEKNVDRSEFRGFDEKIRNKFLYRTVLGMNSSPEDNLAELQFDFLREKAEAGESFVVVGRCAESVLKGNPHLITVFLNGDWEMKVQRTMELFDLERDDAEDYVEYENIKRKRYHNSHSKSKWGDSRNYELTMNSSVFGIDGTVDMLIKYIDERIRLFDKEK